MIEGPTDERVPKLVLLRPGVGDRPLFIVHQLFGDVLQMLPLALALDTGRPIYGLQARGLDPREQPQTRVEDMAETYVETIRAVQPTGPYAIAGYSFGGLVAFEMARVLSRAGDRVDFLGLIDANVKHTCLPPLARWRFLAGKGLGLLASPLAERGRFARYLRRRLTAWTPIEAGPAEMAPLARRTEQSNLDAFDAYRPEPYDGSVTLITAETRTPGLCDPLPVWRRAVQGDLTVERVAGGHHEIVAEPRVRVLADRIAAHLDKPSQAD